MPKPLVSYEAIRESIENIEITNQLFDTGIIPPDRETKMLQFFDEDPDQSTHPLIYRLDAELITDFLTQTSLLDLSVFDFGSDSNKGYQVSTYIKLGKPIIGNDFQGIIEPVAVKVPPVGSHFNHKLDKLLFPNHYIAMDLNGNTYSDKTEAEKKIQNRDRVGSNPTLKIHLDLKLTRNFINNATDTKFMFFQFARNAQLGRLTMIITCSTDISGFPRIESRLTDRTGKIQTGFSLDDHDLLP